MAHVQAELGGGMFLLRSLDFADLFTRDDLSDEQRLFGRTAAEFMKPLRTVTFALSASFSGSSSARRRRTSGDSCARTSGLSNAF